MFFQIQVFLYSLLFFGFLEFAASENASEALSNIFDQHLWLGVLTILATLFYFYQIAKKISGHYSMTPISVVFIISSFALLYLIESRTGQHLLSVLGSISYYFLHISLYRLKSCKKDKTAKGIIAAATVTTIFLFYSAAYGFYLNFSISLGLLMITLMMVTTLVSFQYFWLIEDGRKIVLNYSLVLGLVMAEIVWVVNFWPFGYLTTGVITLIFYYVFWDMVHCHFLQQLSQRRVIGNMLFFGLLVAVVLTSSRWLPVV